MNTENETKTIVQVMTETGVKVTWHPVRAAQETESEFKTWQLHYVGTVTNKDGRAETFQWRAGYGCAMTPEIKLLLKAAERSLSSIAPRSQFLGLHGMKEQELLHIMQGKNPNRLFNQDAARKFFEWLLRKWTPAPEDLLNSLKLDASLGLESFEEFCANIGADTDSRKAEASWHECRETERKLRGLMGRDGFEALMSAESL
jgi:hypothetical protein